MILLFLFVFTVWININLFQSSHYKQMTLGDYFFVPNNTRSVFSNNSEKITIDHGAVKIFDNLVCQKNIKMGNNSTFEFNICEDKDGQYLQKFENKNYFIYNIHMGKMTFYSLKLSNNSPYTECESSFAIKKLFGLNRKILIVKCRNQTYKFAEGLGLFYYQKNSNKFFLKKLSPLTDGKGDL